MPHWLWIIALIPAAFLGVGLLVYLFGEQEPPFRGIHPRQVAAGLLELGVVGFYCTGMLCVVLGPALLLYYAAHLSYGMSAWIGLPIGMALLVPSLTFIIRRDIAKKPDEKKPIEPEIDD